MLIFRKRSSVGQSTCLTCRGSVVRAHPFPPKKRRMSLRHPSFILPEVAERTWLSSNAQKAHVHIRVAYPALCLATCTIRANAHGPPNRSPHSRTVSPRAPRPTINPKGLVVFSFFVFRSGSTLRRMLRIPNRVCYSSAVHDELNAMLHSDYLS